MSEAATNQKIDHKNILTPPGTLLVWIVVINEMLIFMIGIILIARFRHLNKSTFASEQMHLNINFGLFYTILLLVSGYLAAEGTKFFFLKQNKKSLVSFCFSAIIGTIFLVSKFFDYQKKLNQSLSIQHNDFWEYYWLATGFHYLHVLFGVFLLYAICWGIYRQNLKDPEFAIRGSILFWHMCDLIWLFLFPIFYFR